MPILCEYWNDWYTYAPFVFFHRNLILVVLHNNFILLLQIIFGELGPKATLHTIKTPDIIRTTIINEHKLGDFTVAYLRFFFFFIFHIIDLLTQGPYLVEYLISKFEFKIVIKLTDKLVFPNLFDTTGYLLPRERTAVLNCECIYFVWTPKKFDFVEARGLGLTATLKFGPQ